MGTGNGVEGEYHTQEVWEEEEFRVGEFEYQVFGMSEGKYGKAMGIMVRKVSVVLEI